jgi:hypothetical protein
MVPRRRHSRRTTIWLASITLRGMASRPVGKDHTWSSFRVAVVAGKDHTLVALPRRRYGWQGSRTLSFGGRLRSLFRIIGGGGQGALEERGALAADRDASLWRISGPRAKSRCRRQNLSRPPPRRRVPPRLLPAVLAWPLRCRHALSLGRPDRAGRRRRAGRQRHARFRTRKTVRARRSGAN